MSARDPLGDRDHERDPTLPDRDLLRALEEAQAECARLTTLVAAYDATERVLRERQERYRYEKLEALGRLAGGVAHDFNNILTAIAGHGHLLLDGLAASDPRRSDVEEIQRASERAGLLTRQLLAFSGQQVIQPRVLSWNAILAEAEGMLRRLVREDIHISLRLDPDLGAIEADPGQMEQVLINLVVNAQDAITGHGQIRIETANVEFAPAPDRADGSATIGRYVMLAVSDTGTGMSEEVQAHAFDPFFTTKGPGQGTGLGLASLYGIVQQGGGKVFVHSTAESGTRFEVLLPAAEQPAPVPSRDGKKGPQRSASGAEALGNLLLVEDDATIRSVIHRFLTRQGYRVYQASGGHQALEIARDHAGELDLVVTDMVMPEMSGTELARQLREQFPKLRILFISGYSRDAASQLQPFATTTSYLAKPFTPGELADLIRAILEGESRVDRAPDSET